MSFIKRQSIHSRKVGDNTFILTSDGDMEMNLAEGKEFRVNADMVVDGTASGPKTKNVYYVTEDGNDNNDGTSQDANGAFASIKKAAEVAPEGSLIIVAPGDYYENNPISLQSVKPRHKIFKFYKGLCEITALFLSCLICLICFISSAAMRKTVRIYRHTVCLDLKSYSGFSEDWLYAGR